ncbi:MAG: TMEM175 family protein [Thermoplasmata archaeon]
MQSHIHASPLFRPGRVEALSDGVFAIVMTLLVLEIAIPELIPPVAETELRQELLELIPQFLGYAVSFILLGLFWVIHHRQLHFVERTDRTYVWINITTLLFVALVPFTTALLSRYPGSQTAVFVYGANLLAISLVISAQWWYATLGHRLVNPGLDSEGLRRSRRWAFVAPVSLLVILGASYIDVAISLIGFAILAAFFIVSPGFDRLLGRLSEGVPETE